MSIPGLHRSQISIANRTDHPAPVQPQSGANPPSRLSGLVAAMNARPQIASGLATAGALVGHGLQQAITCGVPTFLREEVSMQLFSVLLEKKPWLPIALQCGMSLANVLMHTHVRQPKMDRVTERNIGVAGHAGMSPAQIASLPAEAQGGKIVRHQQHSKDVTHAQMGAEALFTAVSFVGLATGNRDLMARMFATQMRNLVYAVTRESAQATLGLTKSSGATHGVNESNMTKMTLAYTAMTLAMGMVQDALIGKALPHGQKTSGGGVIDAEGKHLSGRELQSAIAVVSSLRAACNIAVEFVDASLGKHFENKQVGGQQSLQNIKAWLPLKDYERLLDHSPTRLAWNNSANIAGVLAQQVTSATGHPAAAVVSLFNNAATAAMFGAMYPMINQTYQAHAKIRAAVAQDANAALPTTAPVLHGARPVEQYQMGDMRRQQTLGSGSARRTSLPMIDDDVGGLPLTSTPHASGSGIRPLQRQPVIAPPADDQDIIELETDGAVALRRSLEALSTENAGESALETASRASIDPLNIPLPPSPGPEAIALPPSPVSEATPEPEDIPLPSSPGPEDIPLPESPRPASVASAASAHTELPERS